MKKAGKPSPIIKDYEFSTGEFMEWAREEFPEPLKNHFTYDMLENAIHHVFAETSTIQEFVKVIKKIVPEITTDEWTKWFSVRY